MSSGQPLLRGVGEGHGTVRAYVTRRLLTMLVTVVGVSIVVFLLIRLIPGSIVDQLLGVESTHSQADAERVRAYFGLDQPIAYQYARWLGGVIQGNLGDSFRTARPVWTLIRSAQRKGVPHADASCGNCGAPLRITMAGACEHCGAHVTAGEFDWVLSKIEQDDSYRG